MSIYAARWLTRHYASTRYPGIPCGADLDDFEWAVACIAYMDLEWAYVTYEMQRTEDWVFYPKDWKGPRTPTDRAFMARLFVHPFNRHEGPPKSRRFNGEPSALTAIGYGANPLEAAKAMWRACHGQDGNWGTAHDLGHSPWLRDGKLIPAHFRWDTGGCDILRRGQYVDRETGEPR